VLPLRTTLGDLARSADAPDVYASLRALGFTHVVVNGADRSWSAPPATRPAYLGAEFRERFAALEYADNGMVVYQLLPAPRAAPAQTGPELLANGTFAAGDSGGPAAWTPQGAPPWTTAGAMAAVTVDAITRYSSEPLEIVPARSYRLRVDARSDEPAPEAWFQLQFLTADCQALRGHGCRTIPMRGTVTSNSSPRRLRRRAARGSTSAACARTAGSGSTPSA
jgi:hypothetical protein